MCNPILVVLKLGHDRIRNVWISLRFWSRHIFCDILQTAFLSRKSPQYLSEISHQRSKRMDGWISPSEHRHLGKERSCYKMCVASPSRARADPCPTVTAYTGEQREKELFTSKLDRPWAAGQVLGHVFSHMPKLSFFFSLKNLALSLLLFGAGGWAGLSPNHVLVAGTGQNYARLHVSSGAGPEPELWDLLFCCHTWLM